MIPEFKHLATISPGYTKPETADLVAKNQFIKIIPARCNTLIQTDQFQGFQMLNCTFLLPSLLLAWCFTSLKVWLGK